MSVLSKLQQHYQDDILNGGVLGAFPQITEQEWDGLTETSAQPLVDWILQQDWVYEQDVIFDWIYGVYSPVVQLLNKIVDLGYGYTIANAGGPLSAKNKVHVAHACEIAIRKDQLLEKQLQPLLLDGLISGDPELIALNFQQWMGEAKWTNLALENIEKSNIDQSDFKCSSTEAIANHLIEYFEDPEGYTEDFGDIFSSNWERSCMPNILNIASQQIWRWENSVYIQSTRTQNDIECYRNRVQDFLKNCPLHVIKTCLENEDADGKEFQYLDSVLPLLPFDVQEHVRDHHFFDGQPHTQQLRFAQQLKKSVETYGTVSSRKM